MSTSATPHRGYLASIVGCWCPRCREGKLFRNKINFNLKKNMDMYEHCPVCRQVTDIEVGFYYGTGYISYLIALGITVVSCLLWFLTIGFSFKDNRFLFWLLINSVFLISIQLWLMRFSRSLWLSFFVSYDPEWKKTNPANPERVNKEQQNNW